VSEFSSPYQLEGILNRNR